MQLEIRRATEPDLPQIQTIFEYYVLNTVVSSLVRKPPPGYIRSRYEESKKRKLPYLVAVEETSDQILGSTYALAFRGLMLDRMLGSKCAMQVQQNFEATRHQRSSALNLQSIARVK